MLCWVLFRSMEVEGMTLISVMMMVLEGSPKIVRIGQIKTSCYRSHSRKKNTPRWPIKTLLPMNGTERKPEIDGNT